MEESARNILIIADNYENAKTEKICLENYDFKVTIKTNAAEGEREAASGNYAVLLLGDLPSEKDSYRICRNYRRSSQAPVIFISQKEKEEDVVHAFHVGADDYILISEFNSAELAARIKRHLSRYETLLGIRARRDDTENEKIQCGALKIDKTEQRVFVDGMEKHLTNKEFELLSFLAANPYHVYSKTELYRQIWGDIPDKEGNTVPMHIKKIRKKIERNPDDPQFIETDWGKGYRLREIN